MPSMEGVRFLCVVGEVQRMVAGRKGGGTSPSKPIPGMKCPGFLSPIALGMSQVHSRPGAFTFVSSTTGLKLSREASKPHYEV